MADRVSRAKGRKDIDWDMTQSVKNLVTIHSSVTRRQISEKKYQELDLFRKTGSQYRFGYSIFKEEDELAVMTFNLTLA